MTLRFNQPLRLSVLAVLFTALFSASTTFAQDVTCGYITAPANFFNPTPDQSLSTVAIEDCDDPFSLTVEPVSPYALVIEERQVEDGGTIALPEGRTKNIKIEGESHLDVTDYLLFRHSGDNYVYQSLFAPEPTQVEIEAYAETFFPTNQEAQFYLNIVDSYLETGDTGQFFYDENGEDILDPNTGQTVETRFNSFYYSALDYYEVLNKPYVEAGTYTMVMREYEIILSQRTIFDTFFDFFVKTAYAQYIFQSNTYAITFTITKEVPEPTGASSVLFLPGIQASRLYTDGAAGTENQLWEPNRDADVSKLRMNASGGSTYDVYTRDVIDEVILPGIGGNIYKGFLEMLEELVEDEVIKDYVPFAYDWRYSVEDVVLNGTRYENEVRSVITTLENLAEDSFSGKVTVIGHSNGGLVAKVLLSELARQGKADLVDKVVFIGTPHLGTPKAIGTVLHGYDQQAVGGAVINDTTARDIIKNMPGAYSLLPSEKYLELVGEPVITIREGVSTASMQRAFGGSIEGVTEYKNFLNGLDGRIDDFSDISNPYKTNSVMLQDALDLHRSLDEWEAPAGVEVFNLVGVGLPTVSKVEYRNVTERINCTATIFGTIECDDPVNFVRPYAHFTQYGDETVVALSSETVAGKTHYFDFAKYEDETISLFNPEHADITEVKVVQDYLIEIIVDSQPSLNAYIYENSPVFSRQYEVTTIDSPVRILKEDSEGNQTGVVMANGVAEVIAEIPGSDYLEFAGTKYVIVPKENSIKTYLYGEAFGSYTLTTATLRGGEQIVETQLVNATTSPTMVAEYEFSDGLYSTIMTDYDGDGAVDLEMTLEGEIIQESEITFEFLRNQIINLQISKSRTTTLLVLARLAEEAKKLRISPKIADRLSDALLVQLRDTIKQYAKKRWITNDQRDALTDLINKLINK